MPMLTKEELLFLKRAEGMSLFFDKIGAAKKLISEAQAEMAQFARTAGKAKPTKAKAKAKAKAKPRKASRLEYGVDLPDTLSNGEHKVYEALKQAGPEGRKPRELVDALKMSLSQIGRATSALKKRKLITSTGATLSLTWKVK